MKKVLTLVLALLLAALPLIACGEQTADPAATTEAPAATEPSSDAQTDAPETLPANLRDQLPVDKKFGDDFVILSRKSTTRELETQETTGDIVADGVTSRNLAVEERFGVSIKVEGTPGEWDNRNDFISKVRNSIASGKSEYDLLSTHSAYIVDLGLAGLSYNMKDLEAIDFSKKWWSEFYSQNVDIDGLVFSAIGDIDYTLYEYMMALFVNKKIAADYGITDIYGAVDDGSWTFEKLMTNVKKVYKDENGDNTPNRGDVFGFTFGGHTGRMCATVWDTQMTVKNADGIQELNLPNEKYTDVYNTLYDCVYNNPQNVYFNNDINVIVKEFAEERALYLSERLGATSDMKTMSSEYGIIPFPKYNSDQPNYISSSRDYMSAIAIPVNIDNPEMVGTVTEAMCMYGYQKITPEYYDVTLKYKYLSDATAVRMLDIIRDNVRHDFAMTFTNSLNLMYSVMGDNIKNGVKDISSVLKANTKGWKKNITSIYDTYASLKK